MLIKMTCNFLAKKKQVEIRLMKSTFNSHWDMIQGFFALHEQVLSTIDDGNLEKLRRKNYLLDEQFILESLCRISICCFRILYLP